MICAVVWFLFFSLIDKIENFFRRFWRTDGSLDGIVYRYDVLCVWPIVEGVWEKILNENQTRTVKFEKKAEVGNPFYGCYKDQKLYLTKRYEKDCVFVRITSHNIRNAVVRWRDTEISPYTTLLVMRKSIFDTILNKHFDSFRFFPTYYRFVAENDRVKRRMEKDFLAVRQKSFKSHNAQPEESMLVDSCNKTVIVNVFDCTDVLSLL